MFTGIVQGLAQVAAITDRPGLRSFELALPEGLDSGLEIGASVACDGVCLTVTARPAPGRASFDVMQQSLGLTTLGALALGSRVNVERAARDGAEIGGHPLSGHVDCLGRLLAVRRPENNHVLRIGVPASHMRYVFAKGYIAVNGASLTVAEVDRREGWFEVWLIPETLRITSFADKREGDALNLEIERGTQVVVDTVRDAVNERLGPLLPLLEQLLRQQRRSVDELFAALGGPLTAAGAAAAVPSAVTAAIEALPAARALDTAALAPAETDPLTGLGNHLHLTRCLQGKVGGGKVFVLAYLALSGAPPAAADGAAAADGGKSTRDELLRIVARRIKGQLREVDTAVRIGGDDFVLLFQGLARSPVARERIESLARQVAAPVHIDGQVLAVAAHVGLAAFPLDGRSEATLLEQAERAMAAARRAGVTMLD